MRILFLGDIVGKAGRKSVERLLPRLIDTENLSFVIANCENVVDGAGVDPEEACKLFDAGIDVLTSGNHIWRRGSILDFIAAEKRLLRPLNFPEGNPGSGWVIGETPDGTSVAVVNLIGRTFMQAVDCPFRAIEGLLPEVKAKTPNIFVDMHCEATSEKGAMGWFLAGRVSAVIGSHTHVQTSDEKILPGGTAFLTDAGMCGPMHSVLGVDKDAAIRRFRSQIPGKLKVATGPAALEGVIIDVEADTGRAADVRRIRSVSN